MSDRGSATAETALVLPALVLLTAALCGIVAALATQIRCVDAARAGARAMARGEDETAARAAVAAAGPRGGKAQFTRSGRYVAVSVAAPAGGLPLLDSFTVHAEAEAADESADPSADDDVSPPAGP